MNRSERKSIFGYELAGIVFIVIVGSLLHFTFELSGHQPAVGIFSAVNESVWEHLKLGFWPALVWALLEYRTIKQSTNNFLFAKTVGIYLIPIIIPILFYSYTAVLGESVLAIDILTFAVAVIVGQLVSYKLLTYRRFPRVLNTISLVALVLLGVAFALFTFYPPRLPLFRDPITGKYGITNHVHSF
ncbi:MAG: hypothetical protein JSV05_05460 [Candidatus Bathyarchaeota archaeon]|nr:MAG: hypothetical protein JSV05_05460 [Candidatus Bathyarchaeota archaeon]